MPFRLLEIDETEIEVQFVDFTAFRAVLTTLVDLRTGEIVSASLTSPSRPANTH
jgi:hypothetical protein